MPEWSRWKTVRPQPGSQLSLVIVADLCVENGIDPTCKEEYLTEEDFSAVRLLL